MMTSFGLLFDVERDWGVKRAVRAWPEEAALHVGHDAAGDAGAQRLGDTPSSTAPISPRAQVARLPQSSKPEQMPRRP
eukprot:2978348-Pyramimonas_sp.AAC.1